MVGISRRFSRFGLLAMALSATAGPGYLPVVGPAPLRFQAPPVPPPTEPIELPPLATVDPAPKPATAPDAPVATNSTPAAPVPPDPAALSLDEAPLDPPQAPPLTVPLLPNAPQTQPDQGSMAAQLFLKYFTGQTGTNSTGITLIAPVGFIPPMPQSAPPSSTAKFQTTAPGKP